MIVLTNSASTNIALSLAESVTIEDPYYVFEFKNSVGGQKIFYAPDISEYTGRTSIFNITLTGSTDENLSAGTINMNYNDDWNYFIYQSSLPYQTTLDNITAPNSTYEYIERGKLRVNGIVNLPERITLGANPNASTRVILRKNK